MYSFQFEDELWGQQVIQPIGKPIYHFNLYLVIEIQNNNCEFVCGSNSTIFIFIDHTVVLPNFIIKWTFLMWCFDSANQLCNWCCEHFLIFFFLILFDGHENWSHAKLHVIRGQVVKTTERVKGMKREQMRVALRLQSLT